MSIMMSIVSSWLVLNVVVVLIGLYANRRRVLAERMWLRTEIARMLQAAEAYANGCRMPASRG